MLESHYPVDSVIHLSYSQPLPIIQNILQAVEGEMFNKFLQDLKEQLRNKASFWSRMRQGTFTSLCMKPECYTICKCTNV